MNRSAIISTDIYTYVVILVKANIFYNIIETFIGLDH